MERDRAWRRYIEERIVIRRLSRVRRTYWYRFTDINGVQKYKTTIADHIGTKEQFLYKTLTTTKYDSYHKAKYSPNKDRDSWNRSTNSREYQKKLFLKILKENGLK
jgi:hypothetical protein